MTTTHNQQRCAELCRELREDDARMTREPWFQDTESPTSGYRYVHVGDADGPGQTVAQWLLPRDAEAIARMRNRLAELADHLEATTAEVERLTKERDRLVDHGHAVLAERDALRAENERMRPVVDAACRYRDDGPCFAGIHPAVDAYRAAPPTAGREGEQR